MKVKIEKLVFGGQGMGRVEEKVCFVWNALPDEEIEIEVIKNKTHYIEARVRKLLVTSHKRQQPLETHFLSCSPWQMMSLDSEREWKMRLSQEVWEKIARMPLPELVMAENLEESIGYRNKMEYSFVDTPNGLNLAFFERNTHRRQAIDCCVLAYPIINVVSQKILSLLREHHFTAHSIKAVILRCNRKGDVICGLFIKDETVPDALLESLSQLVREESSLKGIGVYYSTHKSPASVITKQLAVFGTLELIEEIRGYFLHFGLESFFQINIPLFERVLEDIQTSLPPSSHALDLYSGVGSISIPLRHALLSCTLVESNQEAVNYAQKNISANQLKNFQTRLSWAEHTLDMIQSHHIFFLDPPRIGLHTAVIDRVLSVQPERLFYLSCNLSTQARDVQMLSEKYDIIFMKLYNFFPRTPHLESLCVLKRKEPHT